MKIETLEEKIKARANETVQQSIRTLRDQIASALKTFLHLQGYSIDTIPKFSGRAGEILQQLAKDDNSKGWPEYLWREEEERQRQTVMSKMDELQRILMSKDVGTEQGAPATKEDAGE